MITHWQAPGNGNIFDSDFITMGVMTKRSITILDFIKQNNNITIDFFKKNIWNYLEKKINYKKNKSIIEHFYRPLLFYGLIRYFNGFLSLSIEGKIFLNHIKNNNVEDATKSFIILLLKIYYPNSATKNVNLNIFPFKILFYIMLSKEKISKDYINRKIVHISSNKDFENVDSLEKQEYNKFLIWVISSLEKIKIINKNKDIYYLSPIYSDYIADLLKDEPTETFFSI